MNCSVALFDEGSSKTRLLLGAHTVKLEASDSGSSVECLGTPLDYDSDVAGPYACQATSVQLEQGGNANCALYTLRHGSSSIPLTGLMCLLRIA